MLLTLNEISPNKIFPADNSSLNSFNPPSPFPETCNLVSFLGTYPRQILKVNVNGYVSDRKKKIEHKNVVLKIFIPVCFVGSLDFVKGLLD